MKAGRSMGRKAWTISFEWGGGVDGGWWLLAGEWERGGGEEEGEGRGESIQKKKKILNGMN